MNLDELRATLIEWLNELKIWRIPNQKWEDYVEPEPRESGEQTVMIKIFTDNYQHHINAHLHPDGKASLLASAWTRKPRAGETWNRGNDLHDGPFDRETFDKIIKDFFAYEIVAKVKPSKPVADIIEDK